MHVVSDKCLGCRFGDCVAVCPVKDCFKIGASMLVIDPQLCIDCGLCVAACPAQAISHDSVSDVFWINHNAEMSKNWPVVNYPACDDIAMKNAEENVGTLNKQDLFDIYESGEI